MSEALIWDKLPPVSFYNEFQLLHPLPPSLMGIFALNYFRIGAVKLTLIRKYSSGSENRFAKVKPLEKITKFLHSNSVKPANTT